MRTKADLEQEKLHREKYDALSQFDRDILGSGVRIDIPFPDQVNMRWLADQMEAYANEIRNLSYRTDMPHRLVLFMMKSETVMLRRRIKERFGFMIKRQNGLR